MESANTPEGHMRRVIVTNNVTLDGVIQAPGRPDEDLRSCWDRGSAITQLGENEQ